MDSVLSCNYLGHYELFFIISPGYCVSQIQVACRMQNVQMELVFVFNVLYSSLVQPVNSEAPRARDTRIQDRLFQLT